MRLKLREILAHLVVSNMRRVFGDASVGSFGTIAIARRRLALAREIAGYGRFGQVYESCSVIAGGMASSDWCCQHLFHMDTVRHPDPACQGLILKTLLLAALAMQGTYIATSMKIATGEKAFGLFSGVAGATTLGARSIIGFGAGDADRAFHRVPKVCQAM